jgi:hypothetical protein
LFCAARLSRLQGQALSPPRILGGEAAQNLGGVAQLGERLLCKQEVIGSIPFTSTNDRTTPSVVRVGRDSGALAPRERSAECAPYDRVKTQFASWAFGCEARSFDL